MPSISQAKLTGLEEESAHLRSIAEAHLARARRAEERLERFDDILDKVVRAAEGRPLGESNGRFYGGHLSPMVEMTELRKVKDAERQAQEIRALNERIVGLESRLAATAAVATFAKAHKA